MFSTTGTITGIDLGSKCIKLVRGRGGRQPKLLNVAIEEVEGDSAESWKGNAIRALGRLLRNQGLGTRDLGRVHAAVCGAAVQIRQVELPPLNEEELRSSLKYEARKHLSLVGESTLDCQVVSRSEDGKVSTLIAGAPETLVSCHVAVLKAAGVEPELVDVGPLALLNGVFAGPVTGTETVAILDLGASGTTIVMARRGGVLYTRTVPVVAGPAESIAQLGHAVRETSQFFAPMNERRSVERVFLSGGHALTLGLDRSLEEILGISVELLDLTRGLAYSPSASKKMSEEEVRRLAPQCAIGLGLLHWGADDV